ncbi:PREDICTED: uncharacterized protein LOC105558005 [Vollenhovia emeryi]|uniref:uncharacterized protein LOC105558005 n=1 Tax=Vollenhovia emeryi TaxID=411798 RepID=UPI0005F536F4|nr:PREDICTED: uncharacterized protein LOC105558005 [Vollenhovia emeryi]
MTENPQWFPMTTPPLPLVAQQYFDNSTALQPLYGSASQASQSSEPLQSCSVPEFSQQSIHGSASQVSQSSEPLQSCSQLSDFSQSKCTQQNDPRNNNIRSKDMVERFIDAFRALAPEVTESNIKFFETVVTTIKSIVYVFAANERSFISDFYRTPGKGKVEIYPGTNIYFYEGIKTNILDKSKVLDPNTSECINHWPLLVRHALIEYQEYHLVQLIINKLQGHAYSAIEGTQPLSVLELTRRLKRIFGPNKSVDQYRGELANVFMKSNENIFDYVARVQELRTSIIDGETDSVGYIESSRKKEIEDTVMNSFVNGLPSELLIRVKIENCDILEESIETAIQLSKTIEAERARKRPLVVNPPARADPQYTILRPPRPSIPPEGPRPFIKPLIPGQPGPNFPTTKVCYYCKAPGHFKNQCQKYAIYNFSNVETSEADNELPSVIIKSGDLKAPCIFMIDSGSKFNLIKERFIKEPTIINHDNVAELKGITPGAVFTKGDIKIDFLGQQVLFHVIADSIAFPHDGIIGTPFFKNYGAIINYKRKCLIYDDTTIPFIRIERVYLTERSVTPFYVNILNSEVQEGYLPRCNIPEKVYLGEAIVTNKNGKACLPIFNTSEEKIEVLIPSEELQEFTIITPNSSIKENPVGIRKCTITCNESSKPLYETETRGNEAEHNLEIQNPPFISDNDVENDIDHNRAPLESIAQIQKRLGDSDIPPVGISNPVYFFNEPNNRVRKVLELLRLDHLNSEEILNIQTLVSNSADRFHIPGEKLEATTFVEHIIHTTDELPVFTKQYRYPPCIAKKLTSSSPVWIIPKKADSQGNKKWRMVIDYRNLNEKTIGDAYPLPNIIDILDQLGSAKYFSVLDLASGFHQISMTPKNAHKTAFTTPYGHYQFKRMPFGLKNAPATFQRLMDNVLSGLQGNELFVYMDDIVIYARSIEEHEIKFKRLIQRLRSANLKLQPDKCKFLCKEVSYLGHIIGSNGVRPDPDKIKAVAEFPTPRTPKNIKQFLGLAGYYHRFIPNFSKEAKPLTDLLKKNKEFHWSTNQVNAFTTLKTALGSNPILQYPDFTKNFTLTTDASGYAVGGILSQGSIGKNLPIAYTSRVLNAAEQNYSTIEKECLAIIYCVSHFRPYLYGKPFTIVTDHKPLVWLHSVKDPSSRLWKWRTKLLEYEYEIKYKKGTLNNNADALSRNPPVNFIFPIDFSDDSNESLFSPVSRITTPLLPLPAPNSPDPPNPSITSPANRMNMPLNSPHDDYIEMPNLESELTIEEIPVSSDDELSSGSDQDYEEMFTHVTTPYENCPIEYNINQAPNIIEVRNNFLEQKGVHAIFIQLNGMPFDQGAQLYFNANLLPKIQQFRTTAYHPQSNGSIERSHHVLMEYLKTQIDNERNWDNYLSLAMFSYNTSVHEGTKFSPYELVFGKLARLPSSHEPIEENLEPTYREYLTDLFNKLSELQRQARMLWDRRPALPDPQRALPHLNNLNEFFIYCIKAESYRNIDTGEALCSPCYDQVLPLLEIRNDGTCSGAQYSDSYGTWDNVTVQASAKITVKSGFSPVHLNSGKIKLRSGTSCPLTDGFCLDPDDGYSFWKPMPLSSCKFEQYDVLYEGPANKLTSTTSDSPGQPIYSLITQDITFALMTTKELSLCGYKLLRTEHPKLFILFKTGIPSPKREASLYQI